jgi:predicted phosphodiesterase
MIRFHQDACLIVICVLYLCLNILYITAEGKNSYSIYAASNYSPDFNFVAAGDWGCNSDTKETIANIMDKNPKFVLGLGDYSYESTADCWLDDINPVEEKMKVVLGNHEMPSGEERDYFSENANEEFKKRFNLSKEQYYSFTNNNVHFVALSTEMAETEHSRQIAFVNNDLSKSSSDPDIDWIIVYFHRPLYTLPGSLGAEDELRKIYHPIFTEYGVDLVLQAHIHNYQRSYPIIYNNNNDDPAESIVITDHNKYEYDDPKGQIFVIAGTAGAELSDVIGNPCTGDNQNHDDSTKYPYMICGYKGFGFLNVDITNNGRTLSAKFLANDNSKIIDQFNITKRF